MRTLGQTAHALRSDVERALRLIGAPSRCFAVSPLPFQLPHLRHLNCEDDLPSPGSGGHNPHLCGMALLRPQ